MGWWRVTEGRICVGWAARHLVAVGEAEGGDLAGLDVEGQGVEVVVMAAMLGDEKRSWPGGAAHSEPVGGWIRRFSVEGQSAAVERFELVVGEVELRPGEV